MKTYIGLNVTLVVFLSMVVSCQYVTATFSGRQLLSGNHTGMKKNFTGLDYLSIRLDTSSPIKKLDNNVASADSNRDRFWKKHRKDHNAPVQGTVSGPSNDNGLLQGFDGDSPQMKPSTVSPDDTARLEQKKDLLLEMLKDTEDQLAKS